VETVKKHIHLYHINDLHSYFENWPKVVHFINEKRKIHLENGEEMLVFDIGDHMDRFHPISEATLGKANVRLMNEVRYDYVTIGNNEGITLSNEQLEDLYSEANFEVLVGNLEEKEGMTPHWVKNYVIHETTTGLKMGLIGLTIPFQKFYELLDWNIRNPFELLPTLVKEVKDKGADFVVLLSHLGINDDERIAREVEGIDLILGAHTHHILPEGIQINNTVLCGAGKFGMNVGQVQLTVDQRNIVTDVSPIVHSMETVQECQRTITQLKEEKSIADQKLEVKIIDLHESLDVHWFEPSPFPRLLAEVIREWCDAEIGMICAGVLLDSLPAREVTASDLHRICPHPINPCKVILQGDELKEVILQAATPKMEQLKMKGFGFRGKVLGRMVYDGVEIETAVLEDGVPHVTSITINGETVEPDRLYSIATLDMFTFGTLYPEISRAKEKQYYLPEMLRDLIKWKLLRNA
jgi:5'-nucleotidase